HRANGFLAQRRWLAAHTPPKRLATSMPTSLRGTRIGGACLSDAALLAAVGVAGPAQIFFLEHRSGEDEALDGVTAHRSEDIRLGNILDCLGDNLGADALDQSD